MTDCTVSCYIKTDCTVSFHIVTACTVSCHIVTDCTVSFHIVTDCTVSCHIVTDCTVSCHIVTDCTVSGHNEFETGLLQGSCEAPTLFIIFIETLSIEIKQTNVGINLENDLNSQTSETILNILLYCDDILLLTECEEDMQFL